MGQDWKNRIVDAGEVDPASLVPNQKNFRKHPSRQRRVLSSVLDEVGFVQDVIVNRCTGRMLDGHLRLDLALKHKQASIPVKYVDLSEHEEALVLATFDPVGSLAYLDMEAMGHLRDVVSGDTSEAIADLLDELAPPRLPEGEDYGDDDPDDDSEPPDLSYTLTVPGRVVPMSFAESSRLDEAFMDFLETHGMPFGFIRWVCGSEA